MRKMWSFSIFVAIILSLLIGCSGKTVEKNIASDGNEEEITEEESNQEEADENESEENLEEEIEETFADEVKILDVKTVLDDQDEVSDYNGNEDILIEHDELLYVEHAFITELLDYELTYDEENTFAEVFRSKGDFSYEPSHQDDGGAMMDIGQIYVEDLDKYENISEDEEELYKFIEYEGQLYVPERLINAYMKSPLNYERRDQTLEIGLHSETTSVYDIDITSDSSSAAEVTQNASDITIEGKNYDGGIVLRDVNSASKNANLDIDYNYSEIKGFVHNKSDDETIEINFQYDDDKTLNSVDLKPGETHEFDYDLKGEAIFKVVAEGTPGSSSEVVIIGELQ